MLIPSSAPSERTPVQVTAERVEIGLWRCDDEHAQVDRRVGV